MRSLASAPNSPQRTCHAAKLFRIGTLPTKGSLYSLALSGEHARQAESAIRHNLRIRIVSLKHQLH